ncbi:MAG TPA: DUF433 domain-containing protein [Thermoanaerobaculia bacterium]|nr:DUF433 domain-containing protein [Thermoanaerobaculia bacterium]
MNLPAVSDPAPLIAADDGRVIRVRGTRVTLDTVIGAFKRGATPEEIAQDYSAVSLADVYAVIAYYLRHRSEVEHYLEGRARDHVELRREIEDRPEYQELRKRLLARVQGVRATRISTAASFGGCCESSPR